mgnify:FL=1
MGNWDKLQRMKFPWAKDQLPRKKLDQVAQIMIGFLCFLFCIYVLSNKLPERIARGDLVCVENEGGK